MLSLPLVDPPAKPAGGGRFVLTRGNGKLGDGILGWSLPAGGTCPGATPACACYAKTGNFAGPSARAAHARNLELARSPAFARVIAAEVRRRLAPVVRVHVAGDFDDEAYCRAWLQIMRRCPDTRLFFYSRS